MLILRVKGLGVQRTKSTKDKKRENKALVG